MREIKFRIWWPNEDGNGGRMIDNPYWEFKKLNDGFRDMTDWVFMQFTGLKDKNGKEIYEGDILARKGVFMEVFWDSKKNHGFVVRFRNKWNKYNVSHMFKSMIWASKEGEVVGNIYEHPELIN